VKRLVKKLIVKALPLRLRKALAIWLNRRAWLPSGDRAYWATELLADFAANDVNGYHKFLWRHHLAYAETYEVALRFGYDKLNETRRLFFAELPQRLAAAGVTSLADVRSVLEVGCSLGYLLRYMETDVFPAASRLEGLDIDVRAIDEGTRYLREHGSRVRLHAGDMEEMQPVFGNTKFDLVLGSGVLLYLDEPAAAALVATMLRYTGRLLAITALAHPDNDNAHLERSVPRTRDGTWIHNVDRMITAAGGRIVGRRYEGGRLVDGNTVYFLYAAPAAAAA
jgi:SAM-dependent methyltransferase